ncbi:MAG: DEAD/DEAH box helicase [Spirochaetaceae bacterium]|nr:DEAD/DEAH box helicase [Spirochaetaceae bacterium]
MNFTDFNLNEFLQKGILKAGYIECTPVQEQVLKAALSGTDLYVQSQTGTGKTAAYLISIIQEMLNRQELKGKKALIMVPTRELAVQVEQEAKSLLSSTSLKVASFYGGVGYTQQTSLLKKGVDIIAGTPGRVIDLQESGDMDLSNVAFLVVDEADRMFDMGFYPDLRKLIKVLPKSDERQTMLFSATLNTYVKNLAWEYTVDAKEITIEAEQITVEEISQQLFHVSSDSKMKLLLGILLSENPDSVIIFCNTKRSCEVIAKRLQLNGIKSEFIIGDLPQSKRLQVLDSFKKGLLKCLVATDVAARGIDINDLSMVVNYDLPNETENYVHRIGRTARAGKSGKAYTFCSEQDVYNLPAIERYLGNTIPSVVAFDDMMAEDKSSGIYIRTGEYVDDELKHNVTKNRKNKAEYKGSNKNNIAKNKPSKKNNNYKKESFSKNNYKGKKQRFDSQKLAEMSFDERMKLYKEKYGSQQNYSVQENKQTTMNKSVSATQKKQGFFSRIKKIFTQKNNTKE